jgi:SAM-dependent methyltransferase
MHEVRVLDEDRLEERPVAVVSHAPQEQPHASRRASPERAAEGGDASRKASDTQRAFDGVAPDYDRSNTDNPTLCAMRSRTIAAIALHAPAGGRILDLGCGPGTDEDTLADAGYQVTAIDWSPAMVEETRKRIARRGLQERVDVHHLGIHELDRLPPGMFDVVCSNFGPLNCVPDLARAARLIADRVRPGGMLIASVIGRVCPWEIAVHAWRRDWTRMRVRFARAPVAVPLNGRTVWTTYYTPADFERPFASAGFTRISLGALGLFVPPPYMDAFSRRHASLIATLQRLEDRVGGYPGIRAWGDHFLIVMRKGQVGQ